MFLLVQTLQLKRRDKMPIIRTLSGRSEFEYTPDGIGGFFIEYTGRPHITTDLIQRIKAAFKNKLIPGGFNMTNPIPRGFGEWVQVNSQFSPRHASHIAAVLKDMGVIKETTGNRPIMLQF
jgi:hypothetical protein